MSALSICYFVLLFPLAFILHDAEEVIVQHRWMLSNRNKLENRFPKLKSIVNHLSTFDTPSFAIAAAEEFVIIMLATGYVLIQGRHSMEIWAALFLAFTFHQLIHILQGVMLRGYVPGLCTALLLLPYSYLGVKSIALAMHGVELMLWAFLGILFMVLNLRFAHWIGKLCHQRT